MSILNLSYQEAEEDAVFEAKGKVQGVIFHSSFYRIYVFYTVYADEQGVFSVLR